MSEAATAVELLQERIERNRLAKELSADGHQALDELIAADEKSIAILDTVPNKPKTPISSFRIPTDLKQAAQSVAKGREEDLTAVVIRALEQYVKRGAK
jgi:hypothetical protein